MAATATLYGGDVSDYSDKADWFKYKEKFDKKYNSDEESKRKKIFEENLLKIQDHNNKYQTGAVTYNMDINEFTDYTDDELSQIYYTGEDTKEEHLFSEDLEDVCSGGCIHSRSSRSRPDISTDRESINWREKNAVTSVKSQKKYKTCWAFVTAGILEGLVAIKHKKLQSLSTQQLIDCTAGYEELKGGYVIEGLRYAEEHGLLTDNDYPYKGPKSRCKSDAKTNKKRVFPVDYHIARNISVEKLKSLVREIGPVGVLLQVSKTAELFRYAGGLFAGSITELFYHAVLLVGYDTDSTGTNYWIIKNSWGTRWGENGYLRIQMDNKYGITRNVYYATAVEILPEE
ncbi:mexicain-like [Sitophilus oryzae]|uniref:Mexicain-like n=1 Tax=Sitophilus oryzae TaxID=7048 RepID=A0A6J2XNJ3_SITOR|nr:mexicain-like [Sitophilus oryzae]